MNPKSPIESKIEDLELCLLQPDVRRSGRVAELLDEDFVEFGSSGRVFDKAEIVASIQAAPPVAVTATHCRVRLLAPQLALITYRAHRHSRPPVHTLRSSLWCLREGRWRMIFHQGTLAAAPDGGRRPRRGAA